MSIVFTANPVRLCKKTAFRPPALLRFVHENNTEQTTSRKAVENGDEFSPGYTQKATTGPSLGK